MEYVVEDLNVYKFLVYSFYFNTSIIVSREVLTRCKDEDLIQSISSSSSVLIIPS